MTALLRDYKEENVKAATRLAAELGLTNVIVEFGDAFDRRSLAAHRAASHDRDCLRIIRAVSGKRRGCSNRLRGLFDAIEAWRLPDLHEPAVASANGIHRPRSSKPRRATMDHATTNTAEMDELVRTAGFEKIEMEVDEWGMFTVSGRASGAAPALALNGQNGEHASN